MASIPDEDRGEFRLSVFWGGCLCCACHAGRSIHPFKPNHQSDVEFDPQAVSIIRQNWIDKQLKKR